VARTMGAATTVLLSTQAMATWAAMDVGVVERHVEPTELLDRGTLGGQPFRLGHTVIAGIEPPCRSSWIGRFQQPRARCATPGGVGHVTPQMDVGGSLDL
jgi:hypothetical protein